MSVDAMSLFFAILALGANAVVLVAVAGQLIPALRPLRSRLTEAASRTGAVRLAAVVTTVATAGSLYYSEIAGFPPCNLCWVQRGFMYPLALLLIVATWRGWTGVSRYARAAALLGASVSVWHLLIERFPRLEGAVACDPNNPCSLVWVRELGFVTIPYMALSAFLLAAVLLAIRSTPARDARRQLSHALVPPTKESTA